jgi:hypothetical protein
VLPCKHLAMCAECTKAVFTSSSQPKCPVCRSRIEDCLYSVFLRRVFPLAIIFPLAMIFPLAIIFPPTILAK